MSNTEAKTVLLGLLDRPEQASVTVVPGHCAHCELVRQHCRVVHGDVYFVCEKRDGESDAHDVRRISVSGRAGVLGLLECESVTVDEARAEIAQRKVNPQ